MVPSACVSVAVVELLIAASRSIEDGRRAMSDDRAQSGGSAVERRHRNISEDAVARRRTTGRSFVVITDSFAADAAAERAVGYRNVDWVGGGIDVSSQRARRLAEI